MPGAGLQCHLLPQHLAGHPGPGRGRRGAAGLPGELLGCKWVLCTMLCSLLLSLQTLMELACYQHLRLLICSLFVPKCTPDGGVLQPCRAVCLAAELRCQHSLGLLGILWPINCNILPDSNDPVECFQP